MKYTLLFAAGLIGNLLLSCHSSDNNDRRSESGSYAGSDTTARIDNINDSVTHDQNGRTSGNYKDGVH